MRPVPLLLVVVSLAGCAHRSLAPDLIEGAYLAARLPQAGCRVGDRACCDGQATAAGAAAAAGETGRAADLWHRVALACSDRRAQSGAAVRAASRLGPGSAGAGGRTVNVTYRVRLPPELRLFWVGTTVGGRLVPVTEPATVTSARLRVEVHAMRFAQGQPGPLVALTRDLEVAVADGGVVTVELGEAEGGEPLSIGAEVERPPVHRPRPVAEAPPRKGPLPVLEKARPLQVDPPRVPQEFGAMLHGVRPALRVCLDRDGRVDTVRLLEQAHPRLVASMLDMLRDSRHEPYRVGDLAVASCETRPRS